MRGRLSAAASKASKRPLGVRCPGKSEFSPSASRIASPEKRKHTPERKQSLRHSLGRHPTVRKRHGALEAGELFEGAVFRKSLPLPGGSVRGSNLSFHPAAHRKTLDWSRKGRARVTELQSRKWQKKNRSQAGRSGSIDFPAGVCERGSRSTRERSALTLNFAERKNSVPDFALPAGL